MRRRAAQVGAGLWAALLVGWAGRSAWAAAEDVLPDPPVAAPPPPSPPKPWAVTPVEQGPYPWPTVPGSGPQPAPVSPVSPVAPIAAASVVDGRSGRPETSVGGWGQGTLTIDRAREVSPSVPWLAAWLEHRPTTWLRLYAAAELEELHTFGLEQLYLELEPHPAIGFRAGLLLLPLGIINQWHLPTTFLTVERPLTDRLIIPTTWREVGAGLYGALGAYARYQALVVAGLDAAGFSADAPLWGGRGNGRVLAAHDAAFVGRLEIGPAGEGPVLGGGGYWGGASGGHSELAGVNVGVAEIDARLRGAGFDVRAEAAELFIVDSYKVNDYLGLLGQQQVPARGSGLYAELGYDVLSLGSAPTGQALVFFAGYENVNPRSRMSPYNFNPGAISATGQLPPDAPSRPKSFVRGGIDYRPAGWVAFKFDVRVALAAEELTPAAPVTVPNAPGVPRPLPSWVVESARGKTLVGFAAAFSF